MKKIANIAAGIVFVLIAIKILSGIHDHPEKVLDIVKHWFLVWLKGAGIAGIVIIVIFGINKHLDDESTMSRAGLVIMPILIPGLLYLFFGYILWLTIFGVIAGLIIGYFSYVIDDHLLEIWEVRHVVLPIIFGIGFGASSIIAALTENWQDEYVYVSEYATCHELTIERYTHHYRKKGSYNSWDHHKTHYFFKAGEQFAMPQEGKDYVLGTGYLGATDRVRHTFHKWIGGEKLTKTGDKRGFKWIYLKDIHFVYDKGIVYEVEENFFGQAIKNGKLTSILAPKETATSSSLPTEDAVPGVFSMTFDFFKIMATNPDFSLLRWIYFLIYLPFIAGAIFSPELRVALFIFFISSTIIVLVIIAALLARAGSSFDDIYDRFGGFGGGSTGGGGASGRW